MRPPQEGGGVVWTYPFEDWKYLHIANVGDNVIIEFVDKTQSGDFRITGNPSDKYMPAANPNP